MAYQNRATSGRQSSITGDPRMQMIDLQERIYKQNYSNFPFLSIYGKIDKGAKPKGFKCEFRQMYESPTTDVFKNVIMGTGNYTRFAQVTPEQAWRDDKFKNNCIYEPKDMFSIQKTGQTVMVICTPDDNMKTDTGADFTVSTQLTGTASTTRSAPGTIVVMNVQPPALKTFSSSDVNMHGRSFSEMEPYNGMTRTEQVVYDCNYVQSETTIFEMSNADYNWVQKNNSFAKWDFGWQQTVDKFKTKIENAIMHSNRSWETYSSLSPTRTMNGIIPSIKTNITYWNPNTITNRGFEKMINEFMLKQAFRYNPNSMSKYCVAGVNVLAMYNEIFKSYRHTSTLDLTGGVELNLTTYKYLNWELTFLPTAQFPQGSAYDNYLVVFDPALLELKVATNFESKWVQTDRERIKARAIDWEGTILFPLEQSAALLRP